MNKIILLSLTILIFFSNTLVAEKLCIKKNQRIKNSKVKLSSALRTEASCPANFIEVLDTTSFQTPASSPSIENISIALESCTAGSPVNLSGTTPVNICESHIFTKFSNDTFLEITFYGGVAIPSNLVNTSAVIYGMNVKHNSSYYGASDESGEISIFDHYGPAGRYTPAIIKGIYTGVPAGQLKVNFYARFFHDNESGESLFINPGNNAGNYITIKEIRIP